MEESISLDSVLEADKPSLRKRASDWYFKERPWEKDLYEAMGVRIFTKYCPNGGSKFSYWFNSRKKLKDKQVIKEFISLTKNLEGAHAFVHMPLFLALTYGFLTSERWSDMGLNYAGAGAVTLLNIGINILPIAAQRYNRGRANKLLQSYEERDNILKASRIAQETI